MSEGAPQIEKLLSTGDYPDGDVENEKHRPRWMIGFLIATSLLAIMAVGAYLIFGRELFQRPFLILAVVIAWYGALVGLSVGGGRGQHPPIEFLMEQIHQIVKHGGWYHGSKD
ncbi:MAG TPA: hypothetical protein VLY63_10845 [Anaerolineae bacterium]|nr:hypothetical protein [Anaerolineae bacterium]